MNAPITATYRVQIRPDFDLNAATDLVGYLAALGVSHLYSAPLLTATPGSAHGYDVVDPTRVNPALGGETALAELVATLRSAGMGLVVDIVPNHMGVSAPRANPAWWCVLRSGPTSDHAAWFDIDWSRGPVTIPVLADEGAVADLRVHGSRLHYRGHRYPIAPGTGTGTPQQVHMRQHYRLIDWRRGNTDLNYRRFFAVSDLAAVRVEDPAVFDATHVEILRWVKEGLVDGIRVDHPDGLRDPGGYLRRLRAAVGRTWLVVEKILEYGETLPADWPVDGTTGYDASRDICGVFVDGRADAEFPAGQPFADAALAGKRDVARGLLATELARLVRLAPDLPDVADALVEIAAHTPVYRSYLPAGRSDLDGALVAARPGYPDAVDALAGPLSDPDTELAQRFQQFTGAVMAKGVEDTVFYRWTRFIALNEVGGAPDHFGLPVADFHDAAELRQETQTRGMTTLSTHDTKRGEDVRARLAVLTEMPAEWHAICREWTSAEPLGDDDLSALLWQTVVGAWPIERERLHAYAEKAAREQNTATSWDDPDPKFEATLHAVVDAIYDRPRLNASVDMFARSITLPGWSNALGQKLVQLTFPGIPDTYQGCELWDNSLVDPDNRRPVDFEARRELLARLDGGWLPPIDATGAVKLLVTSRALRLRRDAPDSFTRYRPIHSTGPAAEHLLAFDRGGAITVATRLPVALAHRGGFGRDELLRVPAATWRDALTGRTFHGPVLEARELLEVYPVALLVGS